MSELLNTTVCTQVLLVCFLKTIHFECRAEINEIVAMWSTVNGTTTTTKNHRKTILSWGRGTKQTKVVPLDRHKTDLET